MLERIRIVLVRTFHPGNIGAAARAMKTMGLQDLWLVSPQNFPAGEDEALKMARSAADVVQGATRVETVFDAVQDCSLVVASTARQRGYDLPVLNPEHCAGQLLAHARQPHKVALVFGPERMGLNNEDLQYAHYRVTIPTSAEYASLNMAAAVQTLCYEVFKQSLTEPPLNTQQVAERPSIEELERFYTHLEQTLQASGFIFRKHPGEIMQRLRHLFGKAELTQAEVKILRGILSSFQKHKREGGRNAT